MSDLQLSLLNDFQRGFPLVSAPFDVISGRLGLGVETVLETLRRLTREGAISRVGAVFCPNRIGVSTLAAMAVPTDRLAAVAQQLNAYPEINHNYEREHHFNLWFVAVAANPAHLERVLHDIERQTGLAVMRLPMVQDYHIDLGFDLRHTVGMAGRTRHKAAAPRALELDPLDYALVEAIQEGLPLVVRPYAAVGALIGTAEAEVLHRLARLLDHGIIKRFGIVVRHHELGFRANAMVVLNIPDEQVDEIGRCIGASGLVNLCYQRPRRLPDWPYNLFCMIHGKDRGAVLEHLDHLRAQCGLTDFPCEILFSRQRFKQTAARYVEAQPKVEAVA
ncbi:Lrp/AsnC family transcriptional regulator [Thiobacillus denitrificans]|uniref:siroheme decarboxylase subunit beta n=1 Tax=Thiobacillus denitrificans TaxID=36861 RepID=UPI000377C8A1|nr:Lrp/AsnC family transcriptional regulator [Thiobacillus denitrificans]